VSPFLREPIEILLVQENDADVRLICTAFGESRVRNQLHIVPGGDAAMQFLRRRNAHPPHLILLDVDLPGKTGIRVLAEIKSEESLKQIPIVLLTSAEATHEALRHSVKADGFATKPLSLVTLLHAVRSIDDFYVEIVKLSPI
jgi:CheY-like chemotaxis protein